MFRWAAWKLYSWIGLSIQFWYVKFGLKKVVSSIVKIEILTNNLFRLQNFLDNFQAAQQALADASAAAAETAKQNMVEAYSNAKRMLLNVRIKAPIIIVPVDSQSLQAISIDLGHLCISNRCSNIPNSAVVNTITKLLFFLFISMSLKNVESH